MQNCRTADYENVNGFKLSLKIDESGSPKSMTFTVTYKNTKPKWSWPKLSLFFSLLLYFLTYLLYVPWLNLFVLLVGLAMLVFLWAIHSVKSESFTVIPTVGIQNSVKYVIGKDEKFVSWGNIDDVIINEVLKMNCVLYYLSVLVKCDGGNGRDGFKVMPIFKNTKPKLEMIEKIYADIRNILMMEIEKNENKVNQHRVRKNSKKESEHNRSREATGAGDEYSAQDNHFNGFIIAADIG